MNKLNLFFAILHWIFYPLFMFPVIINAETWFYGTKFSGFDATVIHLSIGITGIVLGYFIYKNQRIAFFGAIGLFLILSINILINHIT